MHRGLSWGVAIGVERLLALDPVAGEELPTQLSETP